ncbi:MAG: YgiQ family radical SAM protein [Ignavibacteria bacterium GWB2_35_12]|nr:MAG: YgiQ family radical SAM protein [Ignavibacteria bacterium GWA2_35_8]OGU42622.1 MAG: YgiQ family radical SAM protein [Ignavibacteria bacterium GWB2_35_12]OGU85740.1 MAG: YgiQ family radical SAM protein [Ignavibacteria bacterium RIFOXYA2_FULL_35_10]OGV19156.1 MAG: YgiQ family radical SAM protein [Ignavibacteria bacterium RIFOXYC2_FULL_35_21]
MFLPTTKEELIRLSWDSLDIILISGDVYIDSPYDGSAVIGKVLLNAGYRVGIISQPDLDTPLDITRLGEPNLFWGVSGGCVDSMVANYTALMKKKRKDDLTPDGINNRRPDRAVITYVNLIKKYFKNTKPIIIGGIEASLRRIAHYDYWSDLIRRSILFDSKADILVYGMGEKTILEIADSFKNKKDNKIIKGICYASKDKKEGFLELPSYEEVKSDKMKFIEMFNIFYKNNDPLNAKGLCQKQDFRYLIQNPPNFYLTDYELDKIYDLGYERKVHPYYAKQGKVHALETIQFSIISHQGCFADCNFCSIAVHQGRRVRSRSDKSILKEAEEMTIHENFKGYINDIGGPTANMWDMECPIQNDKGSCKNKKCTNPELCDKMRICHSNQVELLKKLRAIKGIKKVFIGSGIRYDLVLEDGKSGIEYLTEVITHHVSGQMKIAPEHSEEKVLKLMGKATASSLRQFKDEFYSLNKKSNKKQFLTYYFIAAHPGCELKDMIRMKEFVKKELKLNPEQVQIFTPTPSTYSTLMYHTGINPFTMQPIFVEKELKKKAIQKKVITG